MGAMTSSLAAKFAFFPPTPPSYAIVEDPVTGKLQFEDIAPQENVEVTFLDTARGQRIAAMFVRNPRARLTVLYSHGNAADLGQVHDLYVELSNMLRVNLLGYDYTGYGASSGKPTEFNTYTDIEAAFTYLTAQHRIRPEDIILYGQSVGSGPTVDLAARTPRLRGVVLHSPIMSGLRVLYEVKSTFFLDIFTNIDKLPKVECPVFVMHGTADDVVDVSHGRGLAAVCKRPFDPLFIEGARHCDLEFFPEYLKQLRRFIAYVDQHPPPPVKEGEEEDIARRGKKKPSSSGWTTPLVGLRSLLSSPARTPSSTSSSHSGTPLRASASARSPLHFFSSPAASTTTTTSGGSGRGSSGTDGDADVDNKPGSGSNLNGNNAAGAGCAGAGAGGAAAGAGGVLGGWRARLGRPYKAPISELKQNAAAATTSTTTDSRGGDGLADAAETADTAVVAATAAAAAAKDAAARPAAASGEDAVGVKA
ncbi:hypothetical protein CLOP_g1292 [Closterium sp. NIES-67]|nr:hypothetical protein CLOP_g1292 [Closterium sp. NIES-67]